MSNVFCLFIFGCKIPAVQGMEGRQEAELANEMELECDTRLHDHEIGFHQENDQADYFYWWGRTYNFHHRGFRTVPPPPNESIRQTVRAAWEALPEDRRSLLGEPSALVLLGRST